MLRSPSSAKKTGRKWYRRDVLASTTLLSLLVMFATGEVVSTATKRTSDDNHRLEESSFAHATGELNTVLSLACPSEEYQISKVREERFLLPPPPPVPLCARV